MREGDDLVTPLIPRHGDEGHHSAPASAVYVAQTAVSPAAAHAISLFFAPRQYSIAAAQRRRSRRVQRLRSRVRSYRSCPSDASAVESKVSQLTQHFSFSSESYDGYGTDLDEDKDVVDEHTPPSEETPTPNRIKAKATSVVLVTTAGLASYLALFVGMATMVLAAASSAAVAMLGVAGGVLILIVPWVWLNEWRLVNMRKMRTRLDELRLLAKQFNRQVEMLQMEEEELSEDTERLRENNCHLEQRVREKNSGNVQDLVAQVQENQKVLRKMKENLRQVVLHDVIKQILRSDLDNDNVINKYEADILATRLTLSLGIYGIVFDAVKFHRAVGLNPSLGGVVTIVRRLIPDENERLSSFYDSVDSGGDDDDDDESLWGGEEDMYDMFHVSVGETAKLMSLSLLGRPN